MSSATGREARRWRNDDNTARRSRPRWRRRRLLVNRKRIQRLLRLMGLEAVGPTPRLSQPHPEHRIYPYLLRDVVIERVDQVWSTDITDIRLRSGFAYLRCRKGGATLRQVRAKETNASEPLMTFRNVSMRCRKRGLDLCPVISGWRTPADWPTGMNGNRRGIRGPRGRRLMRQRGERIERSFAHFYDTGGMRRTHLRGHTNILKRLLIHAGGFNLGLVIRHLIGVGTPRGLQGRVGAVLATLFVLMRVVQRRLNPIWSSHRLIPAVCRRLASLTTFPVHSLAATTCTAGC